MSKKLPKPNLPGKENKVYWDLVRWWATTYKSDGCSGVPDFYLEACQEHDLHYRYAQTLYGEPLTFEDANARFRKVIQMKSKLRWFSPLSWIRFAGVKFFGKHIWDRHRGRNLPLPQFPLNPLTEEGE